MSEQRKNVVNNLSTASLPMLKSLFASFATDFQSSIIHNLNARFDIALEVVMPCDTHEYVAVSKNSDDFIYLEYCIANANSGSFYVKIQRSFIYKMIEVTLGGKSVESNLEVHNRKFSKIEENIIQNLVAIISTNLHNSFLMIDSNLRVIHKKTFFDDCEMSNMNADMSFLTRFSIKLKNTSSQIDVVIPYDVLLPMKTRLMKPFSNHKLIQQESWKQHLKQTLNETQLKVTVEIDVMQTLNEIQSLKVGDTILTEKNATEPFEIMINGQRVFHCKIGKISEKLAVELINES